jgi:uncharacterized repeat protein (TIGR03803 family)
MKARQHTASRRAAGLETVAGNRARKTRRCLSYALWAVIVGCLASAASGQAPLTVTTTNDSGAGSLRQAVLDANSQGGGEIRFSNVTGTILLGSPLPSFTANIAVTGPGAPLLTVNGNNEHSIFSISSNSTSVLSGITIANGLAIHYANGAGISNAGSLALINSTVSSNRIEGGFGGGIYNSGDLIIIGSTLSGNQVNGERGAPGGSYGYGAGGGGGGPGLGGALYVAAGSVVLTNCTVSGNWARGGDGGQFGLAPGWEGGRGGGPTAGAGGALCFPGNAGGYSSGGGGGGAGYETFEPPYDSCFGGLGGAGGFGGGGGGIGDSYQLGRTNGLAGAHGGNAHDGSGGGGAGLGGGLFVDGGIVTLVNCTVADNEVCGGGGAMTFHGEADNGHGTGGGIYNRFGTVRLRNTLVAGNVQRCLVSPPNPDFAPDIHGYVESLGHNLIGDATWTSGLVTSDLQNTNISGYLGPLADYGGPTFTHALILVADGNPALDAATAIGAPTQDQRSIPRPQGAGVDIGAYELVPASPPHISIQPQSQTVMANGNVTFSVLAIGTEPLHYQWRKDDIVIPGANSSMLTLTDVQPGDAGFFGVAVSNVYGSAASSVAVLTVLVPYNDILLDAQVIPGAFGSVSGTILGATLEPGEPTTVNGYPGGNSVWFRWMAPTNGRFVFSLAAGFDAQLAVYTGNTVNNLTPIAASDRRGLGVDSLAINANQGISYRVRVTGYQSERGTFTLDWRADSGQVPPNDDFAGRQTIVGVAGTTHRSNDNATLESGEPTVTAGYKGGNSVWFQWVAPVSGDFVLSLTADFDSQLAVYAGTSIASLASIGESDLGGVGGDSVAVSAGAGAIHLVRVTGHQFESGTFTLNWSTAPHQLPLNDNFASPQFISGVNGSSAGANVNATLEAGETTTVAGLDGGKSVWFHWKAPVSGPFTVRLAADFDTQLAVYSGRVLNNLTSVGASDLGGFGGDSVTFTALEGTVYRMRVSGYLSQSGTFTATWCWSGNPIYEEVINFTEARTGTLPNKGGFPEAGVVQGSDGDFYGTTLRGGRGAVGTVFRMTPEGALTTLVEFTGNGPSNKGSHPHAGVIQAGDGDFYGTTSEGGAYGVGTVFRMTPAGELTTLVEFTGNEASNKGSRPLAELVPGTDGDLYGTTERGGANGLGTLFKMSSSGVLTTLVEFTGNGPLNKGSHPHAGMIQAADGYFYGTTSGGGAYGMGTVFAMTSDGILTTLVEFTGNGRNNKGSGPEAGLVQGDDYSLYGTTTGGGASGQGTIFRMAPSGLMTTLVEFGDGNGGANPMAGLLQGSDGNFYGTTRNGGTNDLAQGAVFRMTPDGVVAILADFPFDEAVDNGRYPKGELVQASDGDFYGTTDTTVFRMTSQGERATLVRFAFSDETSEGSGPNAMVQAGNGSLYGTTSGGGVAGFGSVLKFNPAGEQTTLVEFTDNGATNKGSGPNAIIEGTDLDLYGTTARGGATGNGTVFKVTPFGQLITLVEFTGNGATNKGSEPNAIIENSDHDFYGTTGGGGASGNGTVFKMTSFGQLTTLAEFSDNGVTNKGSGPSGLIEASDGNFYGTTSSGGGSDHGTIFKVTREGELLTLVEFADDRPNNKGRLPYAGLMEGSDGNFYGSTSFGGASDSGTIWRMTSTGSLTTLVEFSGITGLNNRGMAPFAELVEGSDRNLYGTTTRGGVYGYGTIFRLTPEGSITTLFDFTHDQGVVYPYRKLTVALDGNIYGTSCASATVFAQSDIVFRLVIPGEPTAYPLDADVQSSYSVILQAKANARGAITSVALEYRKDGGDIFEAVPISSNLTGYNTRLVGTTLNGLSDGTTYYYRFRATSSAGETLSPVHSFSTLAEPLVSATAATEIAPTSARLNGTVNARNFDATVIFEYGTDGNSFPNRVPAMPGMVSGNTNMAVNASVAGLVQGQIYFYRIVAANLGGTTVSGQRSFRTLAPPSAVVGVSFGLSTVSARVLGIVNAKGSPTSVGFEYGTDGVRFPNSVAATPPTVSGETNVEVSATLINLVQGTRYHFRVRATSAGGEGLSPPGAFDLAALSGFTQVFPDTPAGAPGFVLVNVVPPLSGAGWQFVGEKQWRTPGLPVSGLTHGQREIEFRPMPGQNHPPRETLILTSEAPFALLERTYYERPEAGSGGLSVTLKPDSIAPQAQWRFLGEDDTQWRVSGHTQTGLVAGTYLVECKPVTNLVAPPPTSVVVDQGVTRAVLLNYGEPDAQAGMPAQWVPFETVSTITNFPYGYVGQIRSDAGLASGFVVKPRVVATAAHVVFNDVFSGNGTPSYVTGMQWLFQRDRSSYEPTPQIPRGVYIFDGYAAARREPGVVSGEGTPKSQQFDVAVLYFLADAGRGGFSGFLASDATDNEFLLSDANKILVGYPIDQIETLRQGRMHATSPTNVVFARVPGNVEPATPFRTYTTGKIRSTGGASGGPLCVQFEGGSYYPAAIYLGGSGQTVVRAIDGDVIELFTRAETSANGGGNNTSGGITHTEVITFGPATQPGSLRVIIEPAQARERGAGWRLVGDSTFRQPGSQKGGLTPEIYTLEFTTIAGFSVPPRTNVMVEGGSLKAVTFTYGSGEMEDWRMAHFRTNQNNGDAADNADPDGDGSSNIGEFVAGTDPNDSGDVFKVLSVIRQSTTCILEVAGKEGRIYELQRYSSPTFVRPNSVGSWTTKASIGPLSGDTQLTLTDPLNHAGSAFYRVRVTRP